MEKLKSYFTDRKQQVSRQCRYTISNGIAKADILPVQLEWLKCIPEEEAYTDAVPRSCSSRPQPLPSMATTRA